MDIPEIQYEVPEWYRDAKFGIFIHYGVYSVPAYGDEWYGHWMYIPDSNTYGGDNIYNHHLETYGGPEKFGYKDFIPDFLNGISQWQANGGAEEWAQLFEEAGAKYVMPVGIHHDSYALYNSDIQTTYNSVAGAGVDFGSGKTKLSVRLSGSGQSCNIRLDSPDGKIICTAGGEDTGGWTEYKTFDYDIPNTSGVHSLYITYDTDWSDLNINWLMFS